MGRVQAQLVKMQYVHALNIEQKYLHRIRKYRTDHETDRGNCSFTCILMLQIESPINIINTLGHNGANSIQAG